MDDRHEITPAGLAGTVALAALFASMAGCSTGEPAAVRNWGTVHEAMGLGRTQARIVLSDVATPGFWAVGALAELRGEVTIADGEVWTSVGVKDDVPRTRSGVPDPSPRATILFGATVRQWRRHRVTAAVSHERLAGYIGELARTQGLPPDRPIVFRIEGPLVDLTFHVVAGQCPVRARMHGEEITSPPYRERSRSTDARVVGVYAARGAGVFAHGGQSIHAHVIRSSAPAVTGHVEEMGLGVGAVIYLPDS